MIDINTRPDTGKAVNMHSAVDEQTATPERFTTVPWAIAVKRKADEG